MNNTLKKLNAMHFPESKPAFTLTLPFVAQATSRFVYADPMREVLSLALVSGKPAILFGPGGHAKSEFVTRVFDCISGASRMVQFFGEGMDESRLFGGVDLRALQDPGNPRIEYNAERSFLAADFFVAEEGFDAPPVVLLSWKDTLTSKALRNGAQVVPMRTKSIVLLTNRQPSELSELGDAVQALVERFPLQVIVNWPSYKAADFLSMFEALEGASNDCPEFSIEELMFLREWSAQVEIPHNVLKVLAELIAGAVEGGARISPRTAVHARELIAASAAINGRETAIEADIIAVKYLPGMEAIAATIAEKITAASNRAFASSLLEDGWRIFSGIQFRVERESSPIRKLQYAAYLEKLNDEVSTGIKPPEELRSRKDSLVSEITKLFNKLGGASDTYLDVKVELPWHMLGVGYEIDTPTSGSESIREQRKHQDFQDEMDDEDDELDQMAENAKKQSPFRSSQSKSTFGNRPGG